MNMPVTFIDQAMNGYFNMQPSEVKGEKNADVEFNKRYLYTKLYSVFKFTLPKDWALNFFRFWLFQYGSIGVIYTKELGWICNPYSITKLNYQYQPAVIEVINTALKKAKSGIIGVNAGIVRLMDDYFGLDDLITRYATQLAQIDRSVNVNLMNCNVTEFFEADSKKQAEEIKAAYEQATTGKPFVVVNKSVMGEKQLEPMFPGVKNNYLVDKLLEARRGIVNNFLTEVGICNANIDKKERLNSQEVHQNDDETAAIVSVIYDNIKAAFDDLNKIDPSLNLAVELRYDYNKDKEVAAWDV